MTLQNMRLLTVGEIVRRVFPNGTNEDADGDAELGLNLALPSFPPDLFAAAAYLLESGGAYHNVIPGADTDWPDSTVRPSGEELLLWSGHGRDWRQSFPMAPPAVEALWDNLMKHAASPVFREPRRDGGPPEWWVIAYALMVVADEACARVGYQHKEDVQDDGDPNYIALMVTVALGRHDSYNPVIGGHARLNRQVASICSRADRDVVCVQPKAHTSEVGCTTRSLTRNLAYLPPRGKMRAHWQRSPTTLQPDFDRPLRALLVPFPFLVDPLWFRSAGIPRDHVTGTPHRWGWFEVKQGWLPDDPLEMVAFTRALLSEAEASQGPIGAVVFPELSLDWKSYSAIAEALRDHHPNIDILVAGSSDNCVGERGNHALSSHFFVAPSGERVVSTTSRPKHHRWRVDGGQIRSYGLESSLDPNLLWWERIPLPQRELNVNVFRRASVLTTMICEDLARSEPCHDVLRALGPNLVVVILMDSVQVAGRWSARYATGLTEDPGSSVLTLTSQALIERANSVRGDPTRNNWSVALWRDPVNPGVYEIECGPTHQGVVLTLEGRSMEKATLDGRHDADAVSWRRCGETVPISLPTATLARFPWLRTSSASAA